jgi:hypothetical protein
MSAAVISESEETPVASVRNFRSRLQLVVNVDDEHTEKILERPCIITLIRLRDIKQVA